VAVPGGARLGEGDRERLFEEAHLFLEWAAWQLADLGVVKITAGDGSKLIDGEPDFRIEFTERGRRFIEDGEMFGYHGPEGTRFDVSEASRWMLDFLEAGGPGQTLTLRDVMDLGYTDGEVNVTDDCGNVYPPESNTYAWGFEVCLWHHAQKGHIEPVCGDEAQREAWEEHLRHQHLPPRPDLARPQPLWDVPFRLVEGVDPGQVQHVGSIEG
jgi:hypothetical protein